eukprot:Gb_23918 [translate_table: standard]
MKEQPHSQSQSQQTQVARLSARMQREIKLLQTDPPPGVCAWPSEDHLITNVEAQIQGPEGTVYAKGIFKLQVQVPERYPFEPPNVRFVTPIYHPNIDNGGRICLDILNLPPKGAWRPSLNIATVLASIGLLLAEPNPDDGLMSDISAEYKHGRSIFDQKARSWTQKYAVQMDCQIDTSSPGSSLLVGQVSNEMAGTREHSKETVGEPVAEAQNPANNKGELKDKGHRSPAKSTLALSKKLSLAREPVAQPTKGSSCTEVVTEAQAQTCNENIKFQPAQTTDMNVPQKLPVSVPLETNDTKEKLLCKVGRDDPATCLQTASKGQGVNMEKGVCMDKENLWPRALNAKIPPSRMSGLKHIDSDSGTCFSMAGIKRKGSMETLHLQKNTSVHSNKSVPSLAKPGSMGKAEFRNLPGSRIHERPISRPLQLEDKNPKENARGRVQVGALREIPTVVVSDSESDDEPVQVRSRLSLSQRTLTGKRKGSSYLG